jgi:hypothetical protein
MSRAARKRAADRRIQPYAWLGAGAVTLGMGAALMGGTAVAFADTGADSPSSANSASSEASKGAAPAKAGPRGEATKRRAAHADRASAAADDSGQVTSSRRNRVSAVADLTVDPAPAAAVEAPAPAVTEADNTAPAAAATSAVAPRKAVRAARDLTARVRVPSQPEPTPAVEDSPSTSAAPAAAVAPAAADPAPNMESWLPGGANAGVQIVPGARLAVAMGEMKAAQALLVQETWGAGNILAGIGSLGPQALLATAQLSLMIWGATNTGVQNFLASTARIPLVHQVAQIAVFNEMLVPTVAQISLGIADALIPTLGWVGADVDAAEAVVASARQNSKVYAVVPLRVKLGTQPMVNAKIAGGSNASLLLDTGASGLVTTRDSIGSAQLGPKVGEGDSCFSGGLCYHYETYNTTVDLGGGALTTAPVNLVTNNDEYPDGVEKFKEFFYYGDGILGVGANTAGPGPVPIPTAVMPGELHNGVLVFQNLLPFGLGGVMILGPNPLPTRASLPGAPDAFVKVSINGGAKQDGAAIIDSGGVFGTLNRSFMPGQTSQDVPAGTKIDVYTADGATKLYSYTTQGGDAATPFIDSGLFNTGNAAYKQNPIYLNYGATPYGIGSTDFSIW